MSQRIPFAFSPPSFLPLLLFSPPSSFSDIKPANIFMSRNKLNVKLGDLGVTALLDSSRELRATVVGTPLYLSPEVMSCLPYSTSSDIWALGCVLYEMAARVKKQ